MLHPLTRASLEECGVEFEVLECDPALADTAAFVAAYGIPLERSANTIVVASKGAAPTYVACILLATTSLDVNNVVRREMGVRKASFAAADPVHALTGMEIGGVTPFSPGKGSKNCPSISRPKSQRAVLMNWSPFTFAGSSSST